MTRPSAVTPAALLVLFVATPVSADWTEQCAPDGLRGGVRTIALFEIREDQKTGQPIHEYKKSDEHVTRDGKTRTRVVYEADTPLQARLKMFPTIVLEFDDGGRMLREVLKLDGRDEFSVTRCEYDAMGRLSAVHESSKNPELDQRVTTYSYGPQWRRQRWQSPKAVVVITQELDDRGRPIREVYQRDIPSHHFRETSETQFEYDGLLARKCTLTAPGTKYCRETRVDQHGHVVDTRSDGGVTTVTYAYDARGNWTSQRITTTLSGSTQTISLSRREITYW